MKEKDSKNQTPEWEMKPTKEPESPPLSPGPHR